jgi:hypothetical protein
MKNFFAFGLAFAVLFLVGMAYPPVDKLIEGQQRINGELVLGGPSTSAVRLRSPLVLDSTSTQVASLLPDGGLNPINTQTFGNKGLVIFDIPALSAVLPCYRTDMGGAGGTATIANCPFGSQLSVGVDQVMNSTLCAPPTAVLTAVNTVAIQECVMAFDGGACNMPDASYIVRCNP